MSMYFYAATVDLAETWLDFLKMSGKYSQKLYLLNDLSLEAHSPRSEATLRKYYNGNLSALRNSADKSRHDMEWKLWRISQMQQDLRLGVISDRKYGEIIHLFSDLENNSRERRDYFKRTVTKVRDGDESPQNFEDMEKGFQEFMAAKAARRAKKARKNHED